ncbi:hypothetical protein [Streptomyces capoamus]|uniref:hypothetical protein n=1 Tax=Streptomyces capoamus TaxID=68183 RepID=UPI00167B9142|nr:hypothetical protein [Streptomyces capoamus]
MLVHELSERLTSRGPSDLVTVHVETREQRTVQDGAHSLPGALVEASRVIEERERRSDDLSARGDLFVCSFQTCRDASYFVPDGIELGAQLVFGPTLLGSKIKVVVLFAVEDAQSLGVLRAEAVREC